MALGPRAGTRIRVCTGGPDNTLRIRALFFECVDEGIVQPVAKAMEMLSPRLHQLSGPRRKAPGT